MTTALPNLQQLAIYNPDWEFTYLDGEDPTVRRIPGHNNVLVSGGGQRRDITIISNFTKLKSLTIEPLDSLNGRYPSLFNNFPLLTRVEMTRVFYMKWELDMLSAGFPSLRELQVSFSPFLSGECWQFESTETYS